MLKRVRNRVSRNSGSGIRPVQVHIRLCIYYCPTWDQLLHLVDYQLPPLENGNNTYLIVKTRVWSEITYGNCLTQFPGLSKAPVHVVAFAYCCYYRKREWIPVQNLKRVSAVKYWHLLAFSCSTGDQGLSCCCSVTKLCPAVCNTMDCSMPSFPVQGL